MAVVSHEAIIKHITLTHAEYYFSNDLDPFLAKMIETHASRIMPGRIQVKFCLTFGYGPKLMTMLITPNNMPFTSAYYIPLTIGQSRMRSHSGEAN